MIHFGSDYRQSAHPRVLDALVRYQGESHGGYGEDDWCGRARQRVRRLTGRPDAPSTLCPGAPRPTSPSSAASCAPTRGGGGGQRAHQQRPQAGAIEATGHKVLALPHHGGKMRAEDLESLCRAYEEDAAREHIVQPGMVYLSQSTEWGTVYSRAELQAIRAVCGRHRLSLYVDGARLGYALMSRGCDLDLAALAGLADAFTIGLTKQGALYGEAVVILDPALQRDFPSLIKQRGGMMAKGWLMGLPFEALFEDDLYFDLSRRAVAQAERLREGFQKLGVRMHVDSPSNQLFPILPDQALDRLAGRFGWSPMMKLPGGMQVVRFCTSWATGDEEMEALLRALETAL